MRAGKIVLCLLLLVLATFVPVQAADIDRQELVGIWCAGDDAERRDSFAAMLSQVESADEPTRQWVQSVLSAYREGDLFCTAETAFRPAGEAYENVLTGERVDALPADANAPFLNIPLRRALEPVSRAVTLVVSPEAAERLGAADGLSRSLGVVPPALIEELYATEPDARVRSALEQVLVGVWLASGDPADQQRAIAALAADPTRQNLTTLERFVDGAEGSLSPSVEAAADEALSKVKLTVQASDILTVLYHGLSYGSVLFLAALGLAVIFGLMGVINLAQAEFVMIGAYVTWFVQEALKVVAPDLLDAYIFIAIPFAFLGPALVGVLMEWGVVRHLYHRPLLTLLATWAVSLLLINIVRVSIGTQNLSFYTPEYLKSGFTVFSEFAITWTRLLSIFFAALALVGTLFVLYRTRFGLRVRATTQNRRMSGCVGVSTRRTDSMAFAFGSGLAGIAGLALSNIYNVNPTMGTSLIIDSFIVVVVGGVGSVLGTAVAALGIGELNAFIEPQYGAVASKVIVLLAVILFIQQKPNGLFPPKGRR